MKLHLPVSAGVAGAITVPATFAFNDQTATYLPARQLLFHGTMTVPSALMSAASREEFHNGISDRFPINILAMVPFAWMSQHWAMAFAAMPWIILTVFLIQKYYGVQAAWIATVCTPLIFVGREFWPQTIAMPILLYAINSERKRTCVPIVVVLALLRPPIAGLGAIAIAIKQRKKIEPTVALLLGAVSVLAYSWVAFGHWSVTGGYSPSDVHRNILKAFYTGLVSPQRGVLFYCPWLLFIRKADWTLLLSALYVCGEWVTYDAWGGNGYLGFRYALPFVVLAIPHCLAAPKWLFAWSAGLSVYCLIGDKYTFTNAARNPNIVPHEMLAIGLIAVIIYAIKRNPRLRGGPIAR